MATSGYAGYAHALPPTSRDKVCDRRGCVSEDILCRVPCKYVPLGFRRKLKRKASFFALCDECMPDDYPKVCDYCNEPSSGKTWADHPVCDKCWDTADDTRTRRQMRGNRLIWQGQRMAREEEDEDDLSGGYTTPYSP